jgi:hypothetical protein
MGLKTVLQAVIEAVIQTLNLRVCGISGWFDKTEQRQWVIIPAARWNTTVLPPSKL